MIPLPQLADLHPGILPLSDETRLVVADPILLSLARQLAHELAVLAKTRPAVVEGMALPGDIALALDAALPAEGYVLDVDETAQIRGGSARAVAWGSVTLLQSLRGGVKEPAQFPRLHVEDQPALDYRGLMVDLARQWHPIESVRMLVALCRWYKINTLHFHLTDDQSFTFFRALTRTCRRRSGTTRASNYRSWRPTRKPAA